MANVAAAAASDVAVAVAVVVHFFVLFINLICSHKPSQQKDQVSVVSAHCTKPTYKLVASILWRVLMAAHVLISYTPVFSYCCCRLGFSLTIFHAFSCIIPKFIT